MAYQVRQRDPLFDRDTQAVLERRGKELLGAGLIALAVLTTMILGSYSQDDPSWLSVTDEPAANLLGRFGASLAQPAYIIVGWGSWAIPVLFLAWGLRFLLHRGEELAISRAVFGPILVAVAAVYAATHLPSAGWTHSFGMGGLFGDTVLGTVLNFLPFGSGVGLKLLSLLLAVAALALGLFVLGFTRPELEAIGRFLTLSVVMTYAALFRIGSALMGAGVKVGKAGGTATLRGTQAMAHRAADWQSQRREARLLAAEDAAARAAARAEEVFEDEEEARPASPLKRVAAVIRSQIQAQIEAVQGVADAEPPRRPQPAPRPVHPSAQPQAQQAQPREMPARRPAEAYAPQPADPRSGDPRLAEPRQLRQPAHPAGAQAGQWGGGRIIGGAARPAQSQVEPQYDPRYDEPGYDDNEAGAPGVWQAIEAYQPVQRPQPRPSLLSQVPSFLKRQMSAPAPQPAHQDEPPLRASQADARTAPAAPVADERIRARIADAIHARQQQPAPVRSEPPVVRARGPRPIVFDPSKYPTGRAARAEAAPEAVPEQPVDAGAWDAAQGYDAGHVQDDFYAEPAVPAEPAAPEQAVPSDATLSGATLAGAVLTGEVRAAAPAAPVVKPRVMLRATASEAPSPAMRQAPPAPAPAPRAEERAAPEEFAACGDAFDDEDDGLVVYDSEGPAPAQETWRPSYGVPVPDARKVVQHPLKRQVLPSKQARSEAQPGLRFEDTHPGFECPPLSLLTNPETIQRHMLSDEALEENARMLESVLDDYGVRGEIVSVRPGPVVTMYELEPAPGLKASRVIGLADDIARSMSALSARVSTVPGRSVIGIELPNVHREKVVLREILAARDFGDTNMRLPLALGKDIGGEPVVANLAKMPHLLIAGTTGSGKSVAINTMILSLLYRLTPEECRLIMIDPKMLELSVYDGIPHLLSPVVTDPKKAVVALKWVVGEMEERYRKMSRMGVRNIEGYNGRVRDALEKGELFKRTIQTGFDEETGDPIFETEETVPQTFPYIVVIVDEMADLMMVAGKEIEACIQRLAQMARASGIHLIMATQRPSVDVITGTIKANFPTRISFQVTSKIDSRTILGEMGAEQLLGMGDMLHMAGGGRISRVHGPFVSDEEVEEVVNHLKSFGPPEYVGGVVEGPDDSSGGETSVDELLGLGSEKEGDDALYDQAVAIVARDRKCSTSYIQRKLGIGYNKAARLVEQMEDQGVVSPANHVGKREILVPEA